MVGQTAKGQLQTASFRERSMSYGPAELAVWGEYVEEWRSFAVWLRIANDIFVLPPDAALRLADALRNQAVHSTNAPEALATEGA